ncbi:MAG: pantothenate kinase, partial [Bacteroidales bacterium]|nr:pantothenate kinase [Bacteroidales bacterium]
PEEVPVTGSTFTTSVASGVISGIMFEIEGYIGLHPDNIVVFTGGDSNYFAKRMKNSIFVVSNLVLMGLAIIADRYVKKD